MMDIWARAATLRVHAVTADTFASGASPPSVAKENA